MKQINSCFYILVVVVDACRRWGGNGGVREQQAASGVKENEKRETLGDDRRTEHSGGSLRSVNLGGEQSNGDPSGGSE